MHLQEDRVGIIAFPCPMSGTKPVTVGSTDLTAPYSIARVAVRSS